MVEALPLLVSLLAGAAVWPALAPSLEERGLTRENYRGARVACPTGLVIALAAVLALVPLSLLDEITGGDVLGPETRAVVGYVLGVALLGLVDDLLGGEATRGLPPRGWRGHLRAALGGRLSTGLLKAAGTLGLALLVLAGRGLGLGEYLLAVAVLVLATNLFNLLDLRPGRSLKALLLLGAGLTLGSLELDPLWALGLFLGPMLALLPVDLRERGMLGDMGSGAVGAVAGLWLVLTLGSGGQALALALIVVLTAYGEFRSLGGLVERVPLVRRLDSLGRISHA